MTYQLFGVLAHRKQELATPAICTAPFWYLGYHFVQNLHTWVWLEMKDLRLEAWAPANSCAQAALVKRRWTQFCQGADTGKATRINEAKHYQVVEDFWICLACFCTCDLELMWTGSGFGVVVPSSEHPFKFNWTLQGQRSSYEMRGIDLFIENALRKHGECGRGCCMIQDFNRFHGWTEVGNCKFWIAHRNTRPNTYKLL